jgi:putative acetyltransferase
LAKSAGNLSLWFVSSTDPILRRALPVDGPAVRQLVFGVLREFGLAADPQTDADLDDFEAHYFQRGGEFFVLSIADGQVIGSVGLYRIDASTFELRKMYLAREWRGRGQGRRLLNHALSRARAFGAKKVVLETAAVLEQALALYHRAGFQPSCGGVHSSRCDLAMELILG